MIQFWMLDFVIFVAFGNERINCYFEFTCIQPYNITASMILMQGILQASSDT